MIELKKNDGIGIYIHIPFCERKCNYCSFVSKCYDAEQSCAYIDCLIAEIESFDYDGVVDSVFIGGGTPSVLSLENIERIVLSLRNKFNINTLAEWSIECNPSSITESKLNRYKELGFNRLSIGVQSLSDEELKLIGRVHNSEQAMCAVEVASRIFHNINVDLLIGLPNESIDEVKKEIKLLSKYVLHFSIYLLIVEEGTRLASMIESGECSVPDEDYSVHVYTAVGRLLMELGYNQYEVSNYAKSGFECNHNLNYWRMGEYVGFGVSAHSFLDYKRWSNTESIDDYLLQSEKRNIEEITNEMWVEEYIMLGLRTSEGIDIDVLQARDYDIEKTKKKELQLLISNGCIVREDRRIRATEKGMLILNKIILLLVE